MLKREAINSNALFLFALCERPKKNSSSSKDTESVTSNMFRKLKFPVNTLNVCTSNWKYVFYNKLLSKTINGYFPMETISLDTKYKSLRLTCITNPVILTFRTGIKNRNGKIISETRVNTVISLRFHMGKWWTYQDNGLGSTIDWK